MKTHHFLCLCAALIATAACADTPKPIPHNFAQWENDVANFEKEDAKKAPPKHSVLFVGSSTIVRWKTLATDLPGTTVLNRGFGGNQIADSTHFADLIIFPCEPRMIVLRAGGNDIHAGRKAEEVFEDFKNFVATVRAKLPDVPIAYLAVSPSISRIKEREEGEKMNALIAAFMKEGKGLTFIDTSKVSLDSGGQVRADVFVEDMLHFNEEGYKLLAAVVRPFIPKD